LILGSREAAEATVLPVHFLKGEGVSLDRLKVLSLDREVDLRGNPCSSEEYVLKALQQGRGQAGIIGERLWKRLSKDQPDQVSGLKCLWVSPAFSHCVFTASKDLDREVAGCFVKLMLAMNPADPQTAEVMRLEGTGKWVAGSQDGFRDLLKALDDDCGSCCAEEAPSAPSAARGASRSSLR
jgi:ABC-type phosphate/phosphonate transport system substrate-binding protein